jgi:hypothetical protein
MFIPKLKSGLAVIALLAVGFCIETANAQDCSKNKNAPGCSAAESTHTATLPAVKKMEGWANVPGGTVWLEPGRQAYEHDTGLVRDLVTGTKSRPITPQSVQQPVLLQPTPLAYYPSPQLQPIYRSPSYPTPYPAPMPAPYPMPYRNPYYDVGPYGRFDSGRGAISTGRGAVAGQWRTVPKLPR